MEELPIPPRFWERASRSAHRLLMLDYDGTLAPLRLVREQAVPQPRLLRLMDRIARAGSTRIAVVSGRPVEELSRLLGDVPAWLIGEHGWEQKDRDGRVVRHAVPGEGLEALRRAALAVADRPWAERVEAKRASAVLHTRGLPAEEARRLESDCARIWTTALTGRGARLRGVHGGIELIACGRHKGTAVGDLIAASPAGTFPVYVGDDETDEDAFAAVAGAGFGILISPEPRPTRASARLRSIDEMAVFLETWRRLVEGETGPA